MSDAHEGEIPQEGLELSPAKRKRLQQCFEHANRQMSQENYDYATVLFVQCIVGDPSNLLYLQSFFGNLKKKYDNNKKGSNLAFIQGAGARRNTKKTASAEDWLGTIKNGLEVLRLNPWDVSTLTTMATACKEMGHEEVELAYLKMALEANANDPDVARLCAIALGERKEFDQAIAMWHRVEKSRSDDEEAKRAIASLAVEKTITQGGYEETDVSRKGNLAQASSDEPFVKMTRDQRLEQLIERNPQDIPRYLELAEYHIQEERFEQAEEVLLRAYEASDHDTNISERLEDAQVRNLRQKIADANRQIEESGSEEAKQLRANLRKKLVAKELDVYQNRCERYPNNLAFKYELGLRYQLNGKYNDAIQFYQLARNDPRRRGLCMLSLGQCFQQIKQYRLAMSHYDEAIKEIPDRDADNKKKALHLAGKLAIGLKNFDIAEKHLATLAGLDFAYKDVSTLLDKVANLRENEDGKGAVEPTEE